jgi:hypothetical protein
MAEDINTLSKEQLVALVKTQAADLVKAQAAKSKKLKWEAEMPNIIALTKKAYPNLSDKDRANLLAHAGWHYSRISQALK